MPAPFRMHRSSWQRLADHILFPVNMWLSEESSARLGLTPIDHERIRAAIPFCHGKLLDVGCGNNLLVRTLGNGVGVDIHAYPEISARCSSTHLPFKSGSFDTLALLACLNHITRREETLAECRRVLRNQGRILITMIPSWVGIFSHPIRKRHDPDQLERGMSHEEDWGMATRDIVNMVEMAGFRMICHTRFLWWLNNLYVAEKC